MKFFYVGKYPTKVNWTFFIIRFCAGGLMLTHGMPKLMNLISSDPIQFGDPLGLSPELSLILAVLAEVVCAFFVILGLWTRAALIPLIINMVVAVFVVHAEHDFGKKELGIFYLMNYLALMISGPGRISIDYLINRK
ncbi:DoxX family protein [Vaginella massiliensis]|uniref:DoxX family protein n=1 Tax=Vaginella massiliensis TaxID=1816680 RepID=UPI000838A6DC|nr:DoxX family protein [Vaginella massiliensis]